MPKAKTARTPKTKPENKILQMPDNSSNGNVDRAVLEPEIRQRAYQLYEQRGYTNGRAEQDWYEAEQEVLTRHGKQQTA